MIHDLREQNPELTITQLTGLFEIKRSSYYYGQQNNSAIKTERKRLQDRAVALFEESRCSLGSRSLSAKLRGMADSPEASDFTSIQARINDHLKTLHQQQKIDKENAETTTKGLTPFLGDESLSKQGTLGIYFNETDYFTLVDVTGRLIRDDKRGHIPQELKPILCRLGINSANWVESVRHYGRKTYRMLGSESRLQKMSDKLGQCWLKGIKTSQLLYA